MLHFTGDRKPQSMHSQPPPGPLFSTFIKYSSSSTNNEAVNKETPIKHTKGSIKNATIKTLFQTVISAVPFLGTLVFHIFSIYEVVLYGF